VLPIAGYLIMNVILATRETRAVDYAK